MAKTGGGGKEASVKEPAGWTNSLKGKRLRTEELFMSKTSPFLKLTRKQHQSATHSLICRTRLRPECTAEDHGPLWWWPRIIQDSMQRYTTITVLPPFHTKRPPVASFLSNQSARGLTFQHRYHHGMDASRLKRSRWDRTLQTTAAHKETRYSAAAFESASTT